MDREEIYAIQETASNKKGIRKGEENLARKTSREEWRVRVNEMR